MTHVESAFQRKIYTHTRNIDLTRRSHDATELLQGNQNSILIVDGNLYMLPAGNHAFINPTYIHMDHISSIYGDK